MINLRAVYAHAEEHTKLIMFGLFGLLVLLIILQSMFSAMFVIAALALVIAIIVAVVRPFFILSFIAIYLPFETIVLKFTPDEIYLFARYFSEGMIYLVALVVLYQIISGKIKLKKTQFDLPFLLFVFVLIASAVINFVSPTIAILGARQILRFMIVFFLIIYLQPKTRQIKTLVTVLLTIVIFQSMLGITQAMMGEPLDLLLLPSESRSVGTIQLVEGVEQFWDPGARVFATLGRYDRLGNFLYFFLLLATGMIFVNAYRKHNDRLWPIFFLGIPALILTFSRSSWFAFALGFLFVGIWVKRNRPIMVGTAAAIILAVSFLFVSGMNVRFITEVPGQTFTERFYESFSYARWRSEYVGLGRVFWFVHTPLDVVSASPLFGFGPGQFGGGAAAALHNSSVYESLGLPFGVFGTEGFIDNNWFSIWGESGTLGIVFYVWIYLAVFLFAYRTYRKHKDPFTRSLAIGLCAVMIGIAFNAFTSTIFEIRTTGYYLWFFAGIVYVLGNRRVQKVAPKAREKYENNSSK